MKLILSILIVVLCSGCYTTRQFEPVKFPGTGHLDCDCMKKKKPSIVKCPKL
jgi:hypothetical protein